MDKLGHTIGCIDPGPLLPEDPPANIDLTVFDQLVYGDQLNALYATWITTPYSNYVKEHLEKEHGGLPTCDAPWFLQFPRKHFNVLSDISQRILDDNSNDREGDDDATEENDGKTDYNPTKKPGRDDGDQDFKRRKTDHQQLAEVVDHVAASLQHLGDSFDTLKNLSETLTNEHKVRLKASLDAALWLIDLKVRTQEETVVNQKPVIIEAKASGQDYTGAIRELQKTANDKVRKLIQKKLDSKQPITKQFYDNIKRSMGVV